MYMCIYINILNTCIHVYVARLDGEGEAYDGVGAGQVGDDLRSPLFLIVQLSCLFIHYVLLFCMCFCCAYVACCVCLIC